MGVHWENDAQSAEREVQLADGGVAWFPPAPKAAAGALFSATDPYQARRTSGPSRAHLVIRLCAARRPSPPTAPHAPLQGAMPRKRRPIEPMSRTDADLDPPPPKEAGGDQAGPRRGARVKMSAEAASAAANCPYIAFYAQTAGVGAKRDRGDELWNPAKWE